MATLKSAVVGALLMASACALRLQEKASIPDIVIFGIGDSGTRGVKSMMQNLGVKMCSQVPVSGSEDNILTRPANGYIPELLSAAKGHVSETRGYRSSPLFDEAVGAVRIGAEQTHTCIEKDLGHDLGLNRDIAKAAEFRWGYKNPRGMYLMPVMDAAFHRKQHMLAVARDPRDLCSGSNQHRYQDLEGVVKKLPEDLSLLIDSLNASDPYYLAMGSRLETNVSDHLTCMEFWARAWVSILMEYGGSDRFLIVRIEDLVTPDPTASDTSAAILARMMNHAGLSPGREERQKELNKSHSYLHVYMGNGRTAEERQELEKEVASHTGFVHNVMRALGYDVEHYGLKKPAHPRVIRHEFP